MSAVPAPPDPVAAVLSTQHGVISLGQCRTLGFTDKQVRHRLASGRWERVAPSVYGVVHHRIGWHRSLWIAHLSGGPDSVVSHEAAGRLHGFAQVPAGRTVLIVPASRRHGAAANRFHRLDDLEADDIVHIDDLPVTARARTIVDLATTLHPATLRQLVEAEVVAKNVSLARIGSTFGRVRRRGKLGTSRLATVLDELGPGDGLPRSELERYLDRVIRLSGLPAPVHEFPLPGRGVVEGFVDRCWPDVQLIVEGDGRKWHSRRQQALLDSTRTLEAQAVGYETIRVLWEHLVGDPDGTARLLRTVHDGRRELLGVDPQSISGRSSNSAP